MTSRPRILVPVDLDETAVLVLEHALKLAGQMQATVRVMHVWEPPKLVRPDLMVYLDEDGVAISLAEFTQRQAEGKLEQLLQQVAADRTAIVGSVMIGSPAAEVIAEATRENYDLIVMGTHGHRGLSRLLLGSVAEKVVRLASCPVLVVRPIGTRASATTYC